jgi:preprotein translocase subunit SecA
LYIPYIKKNLEQFIKNAVKARSIFHKDKDYVIDINEATNEAFLYIVDFQNTGEV